LGRGVAQLPAEGVKRRAVRLAAVGRHGGRAGFQGAAQDGVLVGASDQLKAVGRLLEQGPICGIHAPSGHGGGQNEIQMLLRGGRQPLQKRVELEPAVASFSPGEPVQLAPGKVNGLEFLHGRD